MKLFVIKKIYYLYNLFLTYKREMQNANTFIVHAFFVFHIIKFYTNYNIS